MGEHVLSVLGEYRMKIFIIGLLVISFLICYSACAVPKSIEEQKQDDKAQLEWIKQYTKG